MKKHMSWFRKQQPAKEPGVSGHDLIDLVWLLAERVPGAQRIPFDGVHVVFGQDGGNVYYADVYSALQVPVQEQQVAIVRAVPKERAQDLYGRVLYVFFVGEEPLEPDQFATFVPQLLHGPPELIDAHMLLYTTPSGKLEYPQTIGGTSLKSHTTAKLIQATLQQEARDEGYFTVAPGGRLEHMVTQNPHYDILFANDLYQAMMEMLANKKYGVSPTLYTIAYLFTPRARCYRQKEMLPANAVLGEEST